MSRKKKRKKEAPEELLPAEPGAEPVPEADPSAEVDEQEPQSPEVPASVSPPAEPEPAPARGSLGASLSRWWRRLSKPAEAEPVLAPAPEGMPEASPVEVVEPPPPPETAEPTPAAPGDEEDELLRLRAEVSHLRSTQDRATELNRSLSAEVERLTQQLADKDSSFASIREELEAARRQFGEELATRSARLAQLETALEERSRDAEAARAQVREQELRAQGLEAQRARQKPVEEELAAKGNELARQLAEKEQALSTLRRRSEEEVAQARQEAKRAAARVRDLESALTQAAQRATELQAELAAQKALVERLEAEKARAPTPVPSLVEAIPTAQPAPAAAATVPFAPEKAAELYQQALTPLTILSASADLLAMNPQMDASLRETIQEVKAQSAALLALIKRYTRPPDPAAKK